MASQNRRRQLEISEEQDNLVKRILELTGGSPVLLWDGVLDYCFRNHPELYNDPEMKFKELMYLYWKYANRYSSGLNEEDGYGRSYNYNDAANWNGNNCSENGETYYGQQNGYMTNGCYYGEGVQYGNYEEEPMYDNFNHENNFYPPMGNYMHLPYGDDNQSYNPPQCQPVNNFGYPPVYPNMPNNLVYSGGVRPYVNGDGTVFPASALLPAHLIPLQSVMTQPLMNEDAMSQPIANDQGHQMVSREDRRFDMSANEAVYHDCRIRQNHNSGSGDPGAAEHELPNYNHLNTDATPFTPKHVNVQDTPKEVNVQDKPVSPQEDVLLKSTPKPLNVQDKPRSPQADALLKNVVYENENPGTSKPSYATATKETIQPEPSGSPRGPLVVTRKVVPYKGSRSEPLPITHGGSAKFVGPSVKNRINGMCNENGAYEVPMPKGILRTPPNGIPAKFSSNNNSKKSRGSGKRDSNSNYVRFADF